MKYQYIRNEYVESKSPLNCKTRILKSNWEKLKSISWLTQRECQICSSLSIDMISFLSALLLGLWIKKTPHFLSQSSPFLLWLRCFFCFFLQLELFSSVVIPLPRRTGFNLFYSSKELRSEECLSLLCLRLYWNVKGRNSLIFICLRKLPSAPFQINFTNELIGQDSSELYPVPLCTAIHPQIHRNFLGQDKPQYYL